MIDFALLPPQQLLGAASLGLLFGFVFSARALWATAPAAAALTAALAGYAQWPQTQTVDSNAGLAAGAATIGGLLVGAAARAMLARSPAATPSPVAAAPQKSAPAPAPISAAPAKSAMTQPREATPPPAAPAPATRQRLAAAKTAKPAASATAKKSPGAPPPFLPTPRAAGGDDLTAIKTLGPKSAERLNQLGVFHYDQIAAWTLDNARWIGAAIDGPGRVERGKWIQQARELAAQKARPIREDRA